jgi:cobalt-zinc-cadmium efflux system protein
MPERDSNHNHRHSHPHAHSHGEAANIRLAFFLNLGFAALEIVGGLWTNSLAILSDAVHDLGDSLSLGLAWFLDRYSRRDPDRRFSYGYRRFSLLGALVNTVILLAGSLLVISKAIPRLLEPERSNPQGMAVFAVVGILINGVAVFRLRGSRSLNARAIAWHLLEDVLGWSAVLVVAIILLFADVPILDPILSVLIAVYVLFNVIQNMRQTVSLFLQGVPWDIDIEEIEGEIAGVEHVKAIHHTHVWSLDGEHHILTTHVVIDVSATKDQALHVKQDVKDLLQRYEFAHLTIEIEYGEADCAMA